MISLICATCGHVHRLDDTVAGEVVGCGNCGEVLRVPGEKPPLIAPPPPPIEPEQAPMFEPVHSDESGMDRLVDFAAGVFGFIVAISLIAAPLSFLALLGILFGQPSYMPQDEWAASVAQTWSVFATAVSAFTTSVIALCIIDLRNHFCRKKPDEKKSSPKA